LTFDPALVPIGHSERGRNPNAATEEQPGRKAAIMKCRDAAIWIILSAAAGGFPGSFAQTAAPTVPGVKPKSVATVPIRPAVQAPADTANAMAQSERLSLQSDLVWAGQFNGVISGEISDRMIVAIKEFQKGQGGKPTGVLNPQERESLADTARRRQDNVGWKLLTDAGSGVRLGIPTKLVPQQSSDANGAKWNSTTGTIQILISRRKQSNPTTAALAEQEKKEPAGRKVDYSVVKPDFFVLSGMQGLKKFYIRGQFRGDEVRILTILYDQATEGVMEPVVIAMSSAFNPFPGTQSSGLPPRKTVEYGSGVVISGDGAILTDRQVIDGCMAITVKDHGHADLVADDKDRGLALLRIYGAHGLAPLAVSGGGTPSTIEITGIADPQSQAGGADVSSTKASVAAPGGDLALTPPPPLGFSGAAALDNDGRFAGIAVIKTAVIATAAASAALPQAVLVPGDTVREFLKSHGLASASSSSDARAATVRVICVRK